MRCGDEARRPPGAAGRSLMYPRPQRLRKADRKARLLHRFGKQCAYCGKAVTMTTCTVDHFLPKRSGGGLQASNQVLSCVDCNGLKGHAVVHSVEHAREIIEHRREKMEKERRERAERRE